MSDRAHKAKADIEEKNNEKFFLWLIKMTFRLVDVGYSLPKGQAIKFISFAPCMDMNIRKIPLPS